MSYLDELNEEQRKAVEHINGAAMIIAGPGSGKTRVLTYRISHLMKNGVDPFNILALTFTNKASREMRDRIERVSGGEARNLFMGTFHSVFARLLRADAPKIGYPNNFTIYDTADSKSLIKSIVKEQGLNDKLYKPNIVFNKISAAKNSLVSPKEYANSPELISEDETGGRPKIFKIYELYAKRCFRAGAMDFDDLLYKMHELLVREPKVLYKYQHKFKYVMIDEFQDTNLLQYEIVRKIADVFQNIVVVGDDAQSIYGFRGATIQNILNFEKDYPDLKVFKLEQNYRSTKNIVKTANHLIANNKNQLEKTIWTDKGAGAKIKLLKAATDNEEGRKIADTIMERKHREHYKNADFSILYRTNAQSRSFEEALRRLNIPYIIYGGLSFYQRKEIKDLLAYLKLTVNHKDEEALKRVINYPTRGIGKTTLEKMVVLADQYDKSLWEIAENMRTVGFTGRAASNVEDFVTMIKSFAAMQESQNAFNLASHIGKSTGILRDLYNDKSVEGVSRYENIQELLSGIKEFTEDDTLDENENPIAQDRSLGAYLQNVMLLTDQDKNATDDDTVTLMTIHAAKGLEFKNVFVVGLEENLFPSMMSLYTRDDLEEERRLFYVAVTRAEEHLTVSYANSRYKYGNLQFCEPSRFIEELPDEVVEYAHQPRKKQQQPQRRSFEKQDINSLQRKLNVVKQNSNRPAVIDSNFAPDDLTNLAAGMEVQHQRFGNGKVVAIDGNGGNKIASIFFKDYGQKKIMLKFAKLKILS